MLRLFYGLGSFAKGRGLLIDEIGGEIFLGSSGQLQPRLSHRYQQEFVFGIAGVICKQ
jgi:hypothetical protein